MSTPTQQPARTVAEVGEFGLIESLVTRFHQGPQVLLGPGDDAAVVSLRDATAVVSTDLAVEGRHFRRDWSSAEDIGHRVAAANLSDIAAMGGTATSMVIALGVPGETPIDWVRDLAAGLDAEAGLVGASIVGGDLSAADQIVVAVAVIGSCLRPPVTRSGARPGDVLAVAGRLGWAAAGYAVLARGFRSPRAVVEAHRRPTPPYEQGPKAAAAGATSLIDVSDGLVADAGHLATASRVGLDISSAALDVAEPLTAVGAALGVDPLRFVLTGGDDHALLATYAESAVPQGWTVIGAVSSDHPGQVQVDGSAWASPGGHAHWR